MVPPVNLLLLKVTKRQLRWSNSESFSTRMGNGRRLKRARVRKIDVRYPSSPQLLKSTLAKGSNVCGEAHTQQIDVVNHATTMPQAHDVARPGTTGE